MATTLNIKRKNIDLPTETLRKLSVIAASYGMSLKKYIESVLMATLGAGLTLAGYTAEHYEGTMTGPDSYEIQYVGNVGTKRHIRPYFSFRVGIDF